MGMRFGLALYVRSRYITLMNNASGTMIRRASELDTGSRIVIGGAIRTVVEIHDLYLSAGVFVSFRTDNGGAVIDRAGALYTCVGE